MQVNVTLKKSLWPPVHFVSCHINFLHWIYRYLISTCLFVSYECPTTACKLMRRQIVLPGLWKTINIYWMSVQNKSMYILKFDQVLCQWRCNLPWHHICTWICIYGWTLQRCSKKILLGFIILFHNGTSSISCPFSIRKSECINCANYQFL